MPRRSRPQVTRTTGQDRRTVLIVHDDARTLKAIAASLEPLGLTVVSADSEAGALQAIAAHPVALILMDVRMADLDGYATAQLIREQYAEQRTPIIFVTAFDQADVDVVRGYELEGVDYVFAPIRPEILRAKVKVFLDLFAAQSESGQRLDELREADAAHRTEPTPQPRQRVQPVQLLELAMHQVKGIGAVFKGYVSMIEDGDLGEIPAGVAMALDVLSEKADELDVLARAVTAAADRDGKGVEPELATVDLGEAAKEAFAGRRPPHGWSVAGSNSRHPSQPSRSGATQTTWPGFWTT